MQDIHDILKRSCMIFLYVIMQDLGCKLLYLYFNLVKSYVTNLSRNLKKKEEFLRSCKVTYTRSPGDFETMKKKHLG